MDFTLIDYFKGFHSLKERTRLSAGAQAVYVSILGEFNRARFPERIVLSDRELKQLAGLKSVSSAHEAKNVLKNNRLIDFVAKRGGFTQYQLLAEQLPNSSRTIAEQLPNDSRTAGERQNGVPNTRARRLETGDSQTEDTFLPNVQPARACEELDNLIEYWERDLQGGRLAFEQQSQLEAWGERYGYGWLKAVMNEASESRDHRGLTFKFLRAVVNSRLNPRQKPLKGGERIERTAEPKQVYTNITDTGDEPWYK